VDDRAALLVWLPPRAAGVRWARMPMLLDVRSTRGAAFSPPDRRIA
jgi:hypothetical protein